VKVEAIFQDGVFRPARPLRLREGQRVRLTVEVVAEAAPDDILGLASRVYGGLSQGAVGDIEDTARGAALSRLRAGIDSMNFCSSGELPSRDESHDRS